MLIKFEGAIMTLDDDGKREYTSRGPICINPELIAGVYDHTILTGIHKIRVMEDLDTILSKYDEAISSLVGRR